MGSTPSPTKKIDLQNLVIKPLDPKMDRAAFSCGDEQTNSDVKELSDYFRTHAGNHHAKGWIRAYVGLHQGIIVGYYWLSTQGTNPSKLNPKDAEEMGRIEFASCVYLGMVGVQKEYHRNGIGPTLMLHAFAQALKAAQYVGIYAITLQAVDKRTAEKYAEDFDFQCFGGGKIPDGAKNIWMFIPISTARKALEGTNLI